MIKNILPFFFFAFFLPAFPTIASTLALMDTVPCGVLTDMGVVRISPSDCREAARYCIAQSPQIDSFKRLYSVTDNGTLYTDSLNGCRFDSLYAYAYYTAPGQGARGPYQLEYWAVNGAEHHTAFNGVQQLLDSLNHWDPKGIWKLDTPSFSIYGGSASNTYDHLIISQGEGVFYSKVTIEKNFHYSPRSVGLNFRFGNHRVVLKNLQSGCADILLLSVGCAGDYLPFAFDDRASTRGRQPVPVSVVANDVLNGALVSLRVVKAPARGTASVSGAQIIYLSASGFCGGTDTFRYAVCNSIGCDTASVFIDVLCDTMVVVRRPPLARPDTVLLNKTGTALISPLANDSLYGPQVGSVRILQPPLHGIAYAVGPTLIEYAALNESCDPDSLRYLVCNGVGCDSAWIFISANCSDTLFVFTAFSPNGDGVNDFFFIRNIERYPDAAVTVFNRWGARIFQRTGYKNNRSDAWDGTWNGANQPDGIYFYMIETAAGLRKSGYVELRR